MTKPKHRYAVIVYWSERDAAYIAEVPELPGCAGPTGKSTGGGILSGHEHLAGSL